MQPRRKLSVEEARDYLRPFARAFHTIECEVDAEVLAYGSGGAGAALYDGLRVPSLRIPSTREATFFDGNVWVDGWFENPGELVFVRGNLVARSLYTGAQQRDPFSSARDTLRDASPRRRAATRSSADG